MAGLSEPRYRGIFPVMIQDAPAAGAPLSAALLASMAREIEAVSYFKIETAGAAKALMQAGGVIACDAPRAPWPGLHPEVRRQLLEIAHRLDPLVLRWGK